MDCTETFADLQRFLDAKVRQVKFVDRTFNCDRKRALAIWKFLHENDNGVTNFHFEITAELLDDETLAFLRCIRPEQFQFEIGVQSTNPETLTAIRRVNDWPRLCETVNTVKSFCNRTRVEEVGMQLDSLLQAGLVAGELCDFVCQWEDFTDFLSGKSLVYMDAFAGTAYPEGCLPKTLLPMAAMT